MIHHSTLFWVVYGFWVLWFGGTTVESSRELVRGLADRRALIAGTRNGITLVEAERYIRTEAIRVFQDVGFVALGAWGILSPDPALTQRVEVTIGALLGFGVIISSQTWFDRADRAKQGVR